LEHLSLVRAIAVRVSENVPVCVELDDLIHAGILGLFDAASKYDENKQVAFHIYAKHRIKGAILDSLRDMDWASRNLRERHKILEELKREIAAGMDRDPTDQEIADKMGIDIRRWHQVAVDLRVVGLVSASSYRQDDDSGKSPEFPAPVDLEPDALTAKRELSSLLCLAMQTLSERHQAVISQYYSKDKTMKEIGHSLGVNESRVSQIHRAALEKMGENLRAAGIHSIESVL
jgi:RNA polymerase sigma factor for flagellar operon FliA